LLNVTSIVTPPRYSYNGIQISRVSFLYSFPLRPVLFIYCLRV